MYQIQNSSKLNYEACKPCNNFGAEVAPSVTPIYPHGITPYGLPVTRDLTQTVSGLSLLLLVAVGMFMLIQIAHKH